MPLAHWIRETVDIHLAEEGAPRLDLLREADATREEVAKLRSENREKTALLEKMETELFALKHSAFASHSLDGELILHSNLIDLLQDGKTRRSDEIMKVLQIDAKNIDAIKALAGQLHALQDLKLVAEGPKGWKWIG